MYLETTISTNKDKTKRYPCYLLRETYREGRAVKHRTIANITHCSTQDIAAIKLALSHKTHPREWSALEDADIRTEQGLAFGAVWMLWQIAERLGIRRALGNSRQGKLALWQIIARLIDQGSRLSAVRLAGTHAACDVLGLDGFDEDDLYENLVWLSKQQDQIENKLLAFRYPDKNNRPSLYLYDVTSSYFEGVQNELAHFGYNRDNKKGKKQVVMGLLCDAQGTPVSVQLFPGNTQDTKTFSSQIEKVRKRFHGNDVTFVGDRGMIKGPQKKELEKNNDDDAVLEHFYYISALTKPQIETLLRTDDVDVQLRLFDEPIAEVITDTVRYILRRNPKRVEEIRRTRQEKYAVLEKCAAQKNDYLAHHPRASGDKALNVIRAKARSLKIDSWTDITLTDNKRMLSIQTLEDAVQEIEKLDGCYVLCTNLSTEQASKETIHQRYKDLALVEKAFRTQKLSFLEIRPIYLRKEHRTCGYALVTMLAYSMASYLRTVWAPINKTVPEAIQAIDQLCTCLVSIKHSKTIHQVPAPREDVAALLDLANISLPDISPSKAIVVATKRNLTARRNLP